MTEFLAAILAFPTILFTIPLGVVVGYWLIVMVGAVGVDLLDGDIGDFALGAKAGAAEALEGGVKGAVEGGAKAAMEGGAKAALEGGAKAGASIFEVLGFGGVPVTVSVSAVVFLSWLMSLTFAGPAKDALGFLPGALVGGGIAALCLAVGLVSAGFAVRPLRPMFATHQAPRRAELMGRVCVIASGKVDGKFGHATFEDGGAGLLLNVVCDKGNQLTRGEKALILNYDATRDAYEVEPVDWLLPQELEHLKDPLTASALARDKSRAR
ncbi:hypothetical protein [Archangium violaceum]|uniref:DUF1449 domain-containing protein n=1 Tax=Archangium violaceum Cb vi76 TaxID=1406225 RepID=A0A084SJT2_9BACT|nr:hypothetical protein [Archangium violaceum]KFA88717.1 hypothetical protein Q664_39660 [Archangium violaceum Cb vi76]